MTNPCIEDQFLFFRIAKMEIWQIWRSRSFNPACFGVCESCLNGCLASKLRSFRIWNSFLSCLFRFLVKLFSEMIRVDSLQLIYKWILRISNSVSPNSIIALNSRICEKFFKSSWRIFFSIIFPSSIKLARLTP